MRIMQLFIHTAKWFISDLSECSMYRWEATVYRQFAGMDWADAKQLLGSYGAWPKDSPPKVFKQDVASDIPDSFDARQKWPGSIHDIRNQVTFRMFCS